MVSWRLDGASFHQQNIFSYDIGTDLLVVVFKFKTKPITICTAYKRSRDILLVLNEQCTVKRNPRHSKACAGETIEIIAQRDGAGATHRAAEKRHFPLTKTRYSNCKVSLK